MKPFPSRPGLALFALAALAVPAWGQAPQPAARMTLVQDNQLRKRIEAAEDLVKEEAWPDVVRILQGILDLGKPDAFVYINRGGKGYWTSARGEAGRMIAALPPKGMEFYRLRYNPEAADLLKQARAKKDPELLARVAWAYRYTDSGPAALAELAAHHFDAGHPTLAALLIGLPPPPPGADVSPGNLLLASLAFRQLLSHPSGAGRWTPALLFKAAAALRFTGDQEESERLWKQFAARVGKAGLPAGKRVLTVNELRKELEKVAPLKTDPAHEWPMFRGDAVR